MLWWWVFFLLSFVCLLWCCGSLNFEVDDKGKRKRFIGQKFTDFHKMSHYLFPILVIESEIQHVLFPQIILQIFCFLFLFFISFLLFVFFAFVVVYFVRWTIAKLDALWRTGDHTHLNKYVPTHAQAFTQQFQCMHIYCVPKIKKNLTKRDQFVYTIR